MSWLPHCLSRKNTRISAYVHGIKEVTWPKLTPVGREIIMLIFSQGGAARVFKQEYSPPHEPSGRGEQQERLSQGGEM